MPLAPGTPIGPYEIVALLGAGGMGEVYRARDSRLGRDVALKVLPAALASDADYVARFQREGRVLAALNHPGIATILGLEENAIVMELVEGRTLAEQMATGPLPFADALDIALQIADALEAAHEKGIVHRDLKPANVKITPEGVVKVLDFGLAKAPDSASAAAAAGDSPTLTIRATQAGLIMGTAGYMSPEQAAGKPVDRRADIWAFGVVLWEMLAGRSLFAGETVAHTLADVLRAPIDLGALPPAAPGPVRELVSRCLDRNVKTRLRDIGEARIALRRWLDAPEAVERAHAAAPPAQRPLWLPWAIAAVLAIAGAVGWWRATRPSPPAPLVRAGIDLGRLTVAAGLRSTSLAISHDGSRLAMVLEDGSGKREIYTRLLSQPDVSPVAGTEGASSPSFSPDGQWLVFAANSKLQKVRIDGGGVMTLGPAPGTVRGTSWGDDGNIVAGFNAGTGALLRYPAAGGTPVAVSKLLGSERMHRDPFVLPGGRAILFESTEKILASRDGDISLATPATGEKRVVLPNAGFAPQYVQVPDGRGYVLYLSGGMLMAAAFDVAHLRVTGPSVPLVEDVNPDDGAFAVSANGALVYVAGTVSRRIDVIALKDPAGGSRLVQPAPGTYVHPRFSPDGKRLVFSSETRSSGDIWIKDLERDTLSKLTHLPGESNYPVWTPDGRAIVFRSAGHPAGGLYWIRADGAGEPKRLSDGHALEVPFSISDDMRLAYHGRPAGSGTEANQVFVVPIEGAPDAPKLGTPLRLGDSTTRESMPYFLPGGKWLAYTTVESGRGEVYVRAVDGPGRWRAGDGSYAVTPRVPGELFFRRNDGSVMAVHYTVQAGALSLFPPRVWMEGVVPQIGTSNYDISPDGKRIAVVTRAPDAPPPAPLNRLNLVLNLFGELEKRAGAGAASGASPAN